MSSIIEFTLISVINTTHNVSQKLCHAAADILRHVSRVPGLEEDADTSLTLETVTYLLEDTNMLQTSSRNKMSTELAGTSNQFMKLIWTTLFLGTLKNLKKLEQAFDILNKVLQPDDIQ